jgi:pilus assembly protein CpaE
VLTPPAAVVVVSDASLAGMRDTMRLTKLLKTAVPNAEVTVLMSRVGAGKAGELSRTDFEKGAETKVDLLIPFDAHAFAASAAAGKPIVKVAGRTKAAVAIRTLARRFAATSGKKARLSGWQRILKGGR